MERAKATVNDITTRIHEHLPSWSLSPLVESLQAMRGISLVIAAVLAAEIGARSRFEAPGDAVGIEIATRDSTH